MNGIFVVGLTGPSGSGKTSIAKLLKQQGMAVVDADEVAHSVTETGSRGLSELVTAFGEDILNDDGSLHRSVLAKKAFSSRETTQLLNDITHPLITMEIRKALRKLAKEGARIALLDAPLLFESGADVFCDYIVAVLAAEDIRINRVVSRDNITAENALIRMKAQQEDSFYISGANYVIYTDGDEAKQLLEIKQLQIELRRSANEAQQ